MLTAETVKELRENRYFDEEDLATMEAAKYIAGSWKFQPGNFEDDGEYTVYKDGSFMYRNVAGKLSYAQLNNADSWRSVVDMYKRYRNIYNILDHFTRYTSAIDIDNGQVIDITDRHDQPMIIILRDKRNPKDKIICFSYQTYFGKIRPEVHNLTACIPMQYNEYDKEPMLESEVFYIANGRLPRENLSKSGNRYSLRHGGVWFNFHLKPRFEVETVLCFFDMVEAMKRPKTVYETRIVG